jgi:hypothetical protein
VRGRRRRRRRKRRVRVATFRVLIRGRKRSLVPGGRGPPLRRLGFRGALLERIEHRGELAHDPSPSLSLDFHSTTKQQNITNKQL